uniref:Eukaryotic translation initiation factor 3 subunit D n=1 Tax=Drosophila rhopaloa TaxID=1041015 RepID=A0A6P4FH77_DRORH
MSNYAPFIKPYVQYNEHGWGPCEVPDLDVPYQPFCKSDRLGKICDWTVAVQEKKFPNKYASTFGNNSQYAYFHEDDDATFHLVDSTGSRAFKPFQRGRYRPNIRNNGSLEYYDKMYDRVNLRNEKPLHKMDRIVHTVTTTDDPIIRRLSKTMGNVFATDEILATIMCCTRSNYSWDVVIEKLGVKVFLDKRDNAQFDLLTVNETSLEPPMDEAGSINSAHSLAMEATFINHNFSQQVLRIGDQEPRYKFEEPNPFEEPGADLASVGYRYRKWDLGNDIVLIARCKHNGVIQGPNGELQFLSIKALNEWDSKATNSVEWRQKLDTQRGAVLASELRNNACKLARWTVEAVLAGSDQLKLGYVSRVSPRDHLRHVILGTQQFKPQEFATQINLNMDNAWGILRCLIDIVMKQPDGKFLLMKDPNKPMVRLYDIPENAFDSEVEEEDDSSEPFGNSIDN